jgi:prepilin-type processing-associated H-X9-DG protein
MLVIAFLGLGMCVIKALPFETRGPNCVKRCPVRLNSVAQGLMGYRDQNQFYPRGTYLNANLAYEDRLSWYAELMPYMDNQEMGQIINWDGPWHMGFNNKLAHTVVGDFTCINQDYAIGATCPSSYIGIAGIGTDAPLLLKSDRRAGVFGYDRVTSLADITDGTANTMMVAESAQVGTSWLQGGSATVRGLDRADQPYLGAGRQFGGLHQGGAYVAMADGSVRWISDSISPRVFEALSTMAGGERLPADW